LKSNLLRFHTLVNGVASQVNHDTKDNANASKFLQSEGFVENKNISNNSVATAQVADQSHKARLVVLVRNSV